MRRGAAHSPRVQRCAVRPGLTGRRSRCRRYLCVSLAAYYVFAIIGMQLFSNKFIRGKLVGTAYYSNDYWKNNFDSLVRAVRWHVFPARFPQARPPPAHQ